MKSDLSILTEAELDILQTAAMYVWPGDYETSDEFRANLNHYRPDSIRWALTEYLHYCTGSNIVPVNALLIKCRSLKAL